MVAIGTGPPKVVTGNANEIGIVIGTITGIAIGIRVAMIATTTERITEALTAMATNGTSIAAAAAIGTAPVIGIDRLSMVTESGTDDGKDAKVNSMKLSRNAILQGLLPFYFTFVPFKISNSKSTFAVLAVISSCK